MYLNIKKNNLISISIILFIPLIFCIFINFILDAYLHHDSLLMYLNYKFVYNYFSSYNSFPIWIDYIFSGSNASSLYLYDISKFLFPSIIIGTFFNINSYVFFVLNLSLLNSIFIFGLYKNIKKFENKNLILFIITIIFLSSNFIQKAFSANLEVFVLFPFAFYYLNKFVKNRKFAEIIKMSIIVILGYINSIQYFSIFYVYFISIFTLIFLIFNFKFKNIIYKKKHFLILATFFFISISYLFFVQSVINENYFLPHRDLNFEVYDIRGNVLYGYQNILLKILTTLSNFFWWDIPLTITSMGVFFNFLFFFSKKNYFNFYFRLSLFLIIVVILIISETLIFYDVVKYFYYLPLLSSFRHFPFVSIYLKPLLLIITIFGIVIYVNLLKKKENIYLLKFKLIFIFLLTIFFIIIFSLTNFINDQLSLSISGQNEKLFFGEIFSKFSEGLNYLKTGERATNIDLFRSLKSQILNSFIINLICLCIFSVLFYFITILNKKKNNLSFLVFLILITTLPGSYYNFANYSFNETYNIFTNNSKNFNEINNQYKEKIISDSKFKIINSIKMCNDINKQHALEKLDKIIPKFSILYENISLFSINKNCNPIYRWDFLNKNYIKIKKKYLHFENYVEYEKINNEKFLVHNPNNFINTYINYSKHWVATNVNNEKIDIINYNGKLRLINSKNKFKKSTIELKYTNLLTVKLAYLSTSLGFIIIIIFIFDFMNTFFPRRHRG